uniref:Small ribosomal subunit protein uS3c n=1 Tax=Lepocinclis steinii TaxID=459226 RepID=A0A3G3LLM4_9EUGL|nr:ribosomal protein S3 [Lepocinclis steinii]AYQ93609.1 ribosomal protein S3 [Lepocinclis steinii]
MGQKISPLGFRIGITKKHNSYWFANNRVYSKFLEQDIFIRNFLFSELKDVSVSNIFIKRKLDLISVDVYLIKNGPIFNNNLLNSITRLLSNSLKKNFNSSLVSLNIIEVANVDACSYLVADSIKKQLEKRLPFRKVIKSAIAKSLKAGVKGIKVQISGRLNGAEIARSEWIRQGQVPLHTLRANIDYCSCKAQTIFGVLGIKVWLYIG